MRVTVTSTVAGSPVGRPENEKPVTFPSTASRCCAMWVNASWLNTVFNWGPRYV